LEKSEKYFSGHEDNLQFFNLGHDHVRQKFHAARLSYSPDNTILFSWELNSNVPRVRSFALGRHFIFFASVAYRLISLIGPDPDWHDFFIMLAPLYIPLVTTIELYD